MDSRPEPSRIRLPDGVKILQLSRHRHGQGSLSPVLGVRTVQKPDAKLAPLRPNLLDALALGDQAVALDEVDNLAPAGLRLIVWIFDDLLAEREQLVDELDSSGSPLGRDLGVVCGGGRLISAVRRGASACADGGLSACAVGPASILS
jgi:hypothetical protein